MIWLSLNFLTVGRKYFLFLLVKLYIVYYSGIEQFL